MSFLAKWYKLSRQHVVLDTFDHQDIRRRMYQLYETKVMATGILMMRTMHLALSRLLLLHTLSSNIESYNGAWNLRFMHI